MVSYRAHAEVKFSLSLTKHHAMKTSIA